MKNIIKHIIKNNKKLCKKLITVNYCIKKKYRKFKNIEKISKKIIKKKLKNFNLINKKSILI